MNEQNLKPNTERTPSERKELARKAGIASGQKRRERKTLAEYLQIALDAEIQDKKTGVSYTKWQASAISIANGMAKGDVRMIDTGAKLLGEYVQRHEVDERVEVLTLDDKKRQILEKIKLLQNE